MTGEPGMYSELIELMSTPLPCKSKQKRLPYRPSQREVHRVYDLLNTHIFKGKLQRPEIRLGTLRRAWGWCEGNPVPHDSGSYCVIRLSDKWYCVQWFVITLAHEMAHQYQWDILGPQRSLQGKDFLMSHGPSFFLYRSRMEKHHIPLKTSFRMRRWFKYQTFKRC